MKYHKHHAKSNNRQKERKKRRKAERKEQTKRDMMVTSKFGEGAHTMCGSKKRYESKGAALAAASRTVAFGAPALRVYPCPCCGGWHLTSKV